MHRPLHLVAVIVLTAIVLAPSGSAQGLPYALFERYLDSLRLQSGIPGLSAAIVKDGKVEWDRGFGLQDVERAIAATPDTVYPVGGLTEAVTGVLLGICTDRRELEVDEPMRRFVTGFPEANATVRQVLAHAAEGRFRYDPARYAALTSVAEECFNRPFRVTTAVEIFDRLGMASSVPGLDVVVPGNAARDLFGPGQLAHYADVLRRVAVPYRVDRNGKPTRSDYGVQGLDAATGVGSTVRDLARLDSALDAGVPLSISTLNSMWSPATVGGSVLPTGLGWFVQTSEGERLVWQFSHDADAYSAIIVKVPARRITLILLANSSGLSAGVGLEQGDATASAFIKIFLRLFV